MKQLFKRALSLLLVVCLLCTVIPSALAAEGDRFTDVAENHWAYSAIYEAVDAGYFAGVSETEFAPDGVLTRAMLVSIMARAAGVELDNSAATKFTDVPAGKWYTGAVNWASEKGVVYGDGDGTFAPNRPATRQETAAIFYRFLKLMRKTLEQKEEEKKFADQKDIASWAADSVKVMQMAGVLSGYPDGTFRPKDYLTRAEAASLLVRFMKAAQDPVEPTEPTEPTEPVTEPEEQPIHVTFVTDHCDVEVEGQTVTELTLPQGVDFVEFIVRAQEGFEVYDVIPSSGRMSQTGSNFVVAGLTEDVTITITDGVTQRTVTFNANNGTEAMQVKVPNGQPVEKPADPVKEDDTFLGWYAASGEEWDFTQPVTEDMALFAYWLNDTYVGATLYVDPVNGKDSNEGTSEETALKTFAAAASMVSPKVTDGVIWIMGTMNITAEETWSLDGRDCVVKRAPSCSGNMINVDGGSLTLKNITIDGNGENVKSNNVIYISNDGSVTIEDGTVITNCHGSNAGAIYLKDGSTLTMNGGKIVGNTADYTGGAIYLSSYNANKCATFVMNGGEISGNTAGSMSAAIHVNSTKDSLVQLNGGVIEKNKVNSTNANASAIGISTSTKVVIGGVVIRDNYGSADQGINSVTAGSRGVYVIPTEKTVIDDPIYLSNTTGSAKTIAVMVPEGLSKLTGKLPVTLQLEYVDAMVICGGTEEGAYALQQSDLEKVDLTNDIQNAYDLKINTQDNVAQFALVPSNDIVVYLNGSSGKDTNDGLTAATAVKTLDQAKKVLKEQIAAAGQIPDDAEFVISVVYRVSFQSEYHLTFADFGENASRCVLRRDAANTMGALFDVAYDGNVTVDNVIIDGNKNYLKSGTYSVFNVRSGARLTVGDNVEVRNFIFGSGYGVFLVDSLSADPTMLTVNGGWYHDLSGTYGVFLNANAVAYSDSVPAQCVINDCLVENISGTYGTICATNGSDVVLHAGTFRNITMSEELGELAFLGRASGTKIPATLTIAPAAEGKKLTYEGGIWLGNAEKDEGNMTLISDLCLQISGPLSQDFCIDGSMMMWGTTVAVGTDGYRLTESDLAHLSVATGDVLTLNTRTNSISIAKVR